MAIPVMDALGVYTKATSLRYKETIVPPSFLKTFFESYATAAKEVSIEVQRGTERMAVDVLRGVDGNRNTFSKSSEKVFVPPFYNENFDATSLDRYDRAFGMDGNMAPATIGYLAEDTAAKILELRNKIERAKEYQAAQVLETGIVTLLNGDAIDFKRKATSMVDASSTPWSTTTTDIEGQLIAGAEFIRKSGKNSAAEFNLVMPGSVFVYLKKSDFFKNAANYQQVSLLDISFPQKTAFNAALHGRISAGAYIFYVWTYDEGYENTSGVFTRYTNAKKIIIVPTTGTRFVMAHAGVPAIMSDAANAQFPAFIQNVAGEYYVNNYIDPKAKSHTFEIMSAPLAIPVTVDMIYTSQVLA